MGPLTSPKNLSSLVVPKSQARGKLNAQIEKGYQIRNRRLDTINPIGDLVKARDEKSKWHKFNIELLSRMFDDASMSTEYVGTPVNIGVRVAFADEVQSFRREMDIYLNRLESIRDRLKLIPVVGERQSLGSVSRASGREVLIVHGHDEAAKESVSRFLEKLDLGSMILHEQPDKGRTIIEKLEDYTNVAYAVVLLTPDDVGAPASKKENEESWEPRARQNVVFELGMVVGKLGRSRVCVLRKGEVEIPSDYHGVVYKDMDAGGGWRLELAKEIKASGIDIDMNRYVF